MSALPSFEGARLILQGFADGAATVDGVFDAQAVGDFVEHGVAEEGVERDVFALAFGDQYVGERERGSCRTWRASHS